MTIKATQQVLGYEVGDTIVTGDRMEAYLLQEGYARDTANTDERPYTRSYTMAHNPQEHNPRAAVPPHLESGADVSDEVVVLTEAGTVTSFIVHLGGHDSASVAGNVSAANLQTALEAMTNVGAGNVAVAGSAAGPYTLTFRAGLADLDIGAITTTVVGGGTVTASVTTQGGAPTGGEVE